MSIEIANQYVTISMKKIVAIAILVLLSLKSIAFEDTLDIKKYSTPEAFLASAKCQKIQLMVNACFSMVSGFYDMQLNQIELMLRKKYKELDIPNNPHANEARKAWGKFRDIECARFTYMSEGGSIHSTEISDCKQSLAKMRIRILKTELNCNKDGGCFYSPPSEH